MAGGARLVWRVLETTSLPDLVCVLFQEDEFLDPGRQRGRYCPLNFTVCPATLHSLPSSQLSRVSEQAVGLDGGGDGSGQERGCDYWVSFGHSTHPKALLHCKCRLWRGRGKLIWGWVSAAA